VRARRGVFAGALHTLLTVADGYESSYGARLMSRCYALCARCSTRVPATEARVLERSHLLVSRHVQLGVLQTARIVEVVGQQIVALWGQHVADLPVESGRVALVA
jgi:hypothetical protein